MTADRSANTKLATGGEPMPYIVPGTQDGTYLLHEGNAFNLYQQERGAQILIRSFASEKDAREYMKN